MIPSGHLATMATAFSWRTVRCRRCGGMDCQGVIDGPIFCRRPDPAVDQGAEPLPEEPALTAAEQLAQSKAYQLELAFWSWA